MTTEGIVAVIGAVVLLLGALGTLIQQLASVRSRLGEVAEKATAIEANVNGAAHVAVAAKDALLTEVENLKKQLAQLVVERKDERAASQQARADVQAGIAAPPPEPE